MVGQLIVETQTLINAGAALICTLFGVLLRAIWDSVKDLQKADKELVDKVAAIEVLVAGQYVTWAGLKDVLSPLTAQLTRIEDKLDGKVDK